MKEDEMSTLDSQLKCLEDIGFRMVDCWYKNYGFVVFAGRKGGPGGEKNRTNEPMSTKDRSRTSERDSG